MKFLKVGLSLVGLLFITEVSMPANTIDGCLNFNGLFASNSTGGSDWSDATSFHFIEALWQPTSSGNLLNPMDSYSPVSAVNEQIGFSSECYASFLNYGNGLETVKFDITSVDFKLSDDSFLAEGCGTFFMTGCDATMGTWQIRAKPYQAIPGLYWGEASFKSSGIALAVDDSTSTLGMVALPFLALLVVRKKKK